MRDLLVITPMRLTKKDIRGFVEAQGGYWSEGPSLDQGVIEENESAVYISGEVDIRSYDYEPDELVALKDLIGTEPKSMIDLQVSHAPGSRQLAEKIARLMIKQWGGFLDFNQQRIRSGRIGPS